MWFISVVVGVIAFEHLLMEKGYLKSFLYSFIAWFILITLLGIPFPGIRFRWEAVISNYVICFLIFLCTYIAVAAI